MKEEKPWENEPDSLEFKDEETSYMCHVKRHDRLKHLCGYVHVPNKLVKKSLEKIDEIENLEVHGGVTFQNTVAYPIDKDKYADYAIGFDCAHWDDILPVDGDSKYGATYKDIDFVQNECRKLAKQLRDLLENEES